MKKQPKAEIVTIGVAAQRLGVPIETLVVALDLRGGEHEAALKKIGWM